jgi:hypothetical protein
MHVAGRFLYRKKRYSPNTILERDYALTSSISDERFRGVDIRREQFPRQMSYCGNNNLVIAW